MSKLILTRINSGYASNTALDTNSELIEDAFDNTLSRDGTSPNEMQADFDMNGHEILNVAVPSASTSAARLVDLQNMEAGASTAAGMATVIHSSTSKTTPVDADEVGIWNSVTGTLAKLSFANLYNWVLTNLGFTQSGTGAVARSLQSKNRDIVSVFDFMSDAEIADVKARTLLIDVTAAVQAAENSRSSGGVVHFPSGKYLISGLGIAKKAGVTWIGEGKKSSVLVAATATWTNSLVSSGDMTGCGIFYLGFDLTNMTASGYPACIATYNFTNGEIAFCDFIQQPIGIMVTGGSYFYIHDNTITKSAASSTLNEGIWIRNTSSTCTNFSVARNIITNTGTAIIGNDFSIVDNIITGYTYGSGVTIDYGALRGTISNNYCGYSTGIDSNLFTPAGIENWGTNTVISGNNCQHNAGAGIHSGGKYGSITGNICIDNGQYSGGGYTPAYRCGIISRYVSASQSGNYSVISGNECVDTGGATQTYGYIDDGSSVTDIILSGNNFKCPTPMSTTGVRYDYHGPELYGTTTGTGFTLATLTSGGGSTVGISGAAVGDIVTVGISPQQQAMIVYGYVVSANTVTFNFFNPTGGGQTLGNYTAYIKVAKPKNYASY